MIPDLNRIAHHMTRKCVTSNSRRSVQLHLSVSTGRVQLASSDGFEHSYTKTVFGFHVRAKSQTGYLLERSYGKCLLDMEDITQRIQAAMDWLARTEHLAANRLRFPERKPVPVVVYLSSPIAAQVIEACVHTLLLKGRLGPSAVRRPGGLTIIDDGLLDWAPMSSPVDDEGTPKRSRVLVAQGDFAFVPTVREDVKRGCQPTGHGHRGSALELPRAWPNTLIVEERNGSQHHFDDRERLFLVSMGEVTLAGGESLVSRDAWGVLHCPSGDRLLHLDRIAADVPSLIYETYTTGNSVLQWNVMTPDLVLPGRLRMAGGELGLEMGYSG